MFRKPHRCKEVSRLFLTILKLSQMKKEIIQIDLKQLQVKHAELCVKRGENIYNHLFGRSKLPSKQKMIDEVNADSDLFHYQLVRLF